MKRILQLLLICLLIIITIIFYYNYLKVDQKNLVRKEIVESESLSDNQSNLIKNLKYEVKFDNNAQYTITSKLSELTYEEDLKDDNTIELVEVVKMQKVTAEFIDEKNSPLIVYSDYASYNNLNYNTEFSKNVLIKFKDNTIKSENLDLDFAKNIVKIYNNVVYDGLAGSAKTDNIKIDLITRKINIFMNNTEKKVELKSK